ncbi:hypothetical protein [Nocardia sp. NRRL S-836]|uniref:hypothetical protein n=1 Tax=Nocardia sp. NRRL S-836 TaxID=1519492 RepID=UPI0006B0347D|nr:hypothetical protein [Nocardia sp. NRRL S-836]KOV81803.1 hypothetical protein ADL03_26850 [Nocardia sp. NRRL S-836]
MLPKHFNWLRDLCKYMIGSLEPDALEEFKKFWNSCTTAEREYYRTVDLSTALPCQGKNCTAEHLVMY